MPLPTWRKVVNESLRAEIELAKKYAAMRKLGERVDLEMERHKKLRPPHGTVGVGSADFDHLLKYNAGSGYLRALRRGDSVESARLEAINDAKETIIWWNTVGCLSRGAMSSRHELHRSIESGEAVAEYWHRTFLMFMLTEPNES